MGQAFALLLTLLIIAVLMAVADIVFNITDRDTKRNEWFAITGGSIIVVDAAGWVVLLVAYIWIN